jgi:DNA polymerase III delta prime subunit
MFIAQRNLAILNGIIKNDALANAYLFYGPVGSFIKDAAVYFAQSVNCQDFAKGPCGKCGNCQSFLKGNFVDYILLEADGKIKIDQIKELCRQVKYGSALGKVKCVVINQAHNLTSQAANAFLKTLEEARVDVTFILLTNNFWEILPTVRSRCQVLNFVSLTGGDLAKYRAELSAEERLLLNKGLDNDFLLKYYLETGKVLQDKFYLTYKEFKAMDKFVRLEFARNIAADKEQAQLCILTWLQELWQDAEELGKKEIEKMELMIENIGQMKYNVNLRLFLENLFIQV